MIFAECKKKRKHTIHPYEMRLQIVIHNYPPHY